MADKLSVCCAKEHQQKKKIMLEKSIYIYLAPRPNPISPFHLLPSSSHLETATRNSLQPLNLKSNTPHTPHQSRCPATRTERNTRAEGPADTARATMTKATASPDTSTRRAKVGTASTAAGVGTASTATVAMTTKTTATTMTTKMRKTGTRRRTRRRPSTRAGRGPAGSPRGSGSATTTSTARRA